MEEDIIKEFLKEKNAKKVDLISLLRTFKKEGLENFIVIRTEKLENLLKAYKEDEAVIEEMANEIFIEHNPHFKTTEEVKEYFRNKVKGEKE